MSPQGLGGLTVVFPHLRAPPLTIQPLLLLKLRLLLLPSAVIIVTEIFLGEGRAGGGRSAGTGRWGGHGEGGTHRHQLVMPGRVKVFLQEGFGEADDGVAGGLPQPGQPGGHFFPLQVLQLLQLLLLPRLLLRTDGQTDGRGAGGDGTDTRQMDAALPAPFSFTPSPFSSSPESAPASPSAAHPVVAPRWGCSGDTSSPWGGGGVRVSAPNPQTVHPSQILPPPHLLGVRLLEAEIVATFKILLLRQEKLTLIRGIGQPEWGCPGWGDTVGGG